jgi:uncharacterized LabA/DUF88 family protein
MRAAIFIDGGYILQQQKTSKISVDYGRIAEHFLAPIRANLPVDLMRCYFYYCAPWMSAEPTEEELRRMEAHKKFVDEVENISRWQVRLGKLERRRDGTREYYEQKRVDVLLSCDLVRHAAAGHIQHAVLVAGDSDFIPAVTAAKESGVTISVWCGPPNTIHKDLVTLADEVHEFNFARMPKRAPERPSEANRNPERVSERAPQREVEIKPEVKAVNQSEPKSNGNEEAQLVEPKKASSRRRRRPSKRE